MVSLFHRAIRQLFVESVKNVVNFAKMAFLQILG